jgi:hypothetical protein
MAESGAHEAQMHEAQLDGHPVTFTITVTPT